MTLFGTFLTETLQRSWSLWRKKSTVRVRNTGRYYVNKPSSFPLSCDYPVALTSN